MITLLLASLLACQVPQDASKQGPAKQAPSTPKIELKYGAQREGRRTDGDMARWRNNRLGVIIHYGLYSQAGGAWNGANYRSAAEFIKNAAKVPNEDYDQLLKTFNPDRSAPKNWARLIKQMGAKYAVITTKHHEGFCLWPSKYTDYHVGSTPYKTDFLGEFVKACDGEGIDVMLYYSIMDWHHKGWRYRLNNESDRAEFMKFWEFSALQLEELLERYPKIKGFWFDGTWDSSVKDNGHLTFELERRLRKINPGLVIGSRLRADETGARHFDANGQLMGDYEQGWERKLPASPLKNDWECVMTIPENQWGYHANWTGHVKDSIEIIEMIARCTALDGNFAMNLGPRGDGSIRDEELKLIQDIGQWMNVNGDAIYNCGTSGLERQDWGWLTRKEKSLEVNAIVFNVPVSGRLSVQLNKGETIKTASLAGESLRQFPKARSARNHGPNAASVRKDGSEMEGHGSRLKLISKGTALKVEEGADGRYYVHLPKTQFETAFVVKLQISGGTQTASEAAKI